MGTTKLKKWVLAYWVGSDCKDLIEVWIEPIEETK